MEITGYFCQSTKAWRLNNGPRSLLFLCPDYNSPTLFSRCWACLATMKAEFKEASSSDLCLCLHRDCWVFVSLSHLWHLHVAGTRCEVTVTEWYRLSTLTLLPTKREMTDWKGLGSDYTKEEIVVRENNREPTHTHKALTNRWVFRGKRTLSVCLPVAAAFQF